MQTMPHTHTRNCCTSNREIYQGTQILVLFFSEVDGCGGRTMWSERRAIATAIKTNSRNDQEENELRDVPSSLFSIKSR